MAYDFTIITAIQAQALIGATNDPLTALEPTSGRGAPNAITLGDDLPAQVRKFLAGDHWQDGDGWVGPKPSLTSGGASDTNALNLIEERFVSRNMIADITYRHVDGVVGREPTWGFTVRRALADDEAPTDAEQNDIDGIEAELTAWWDKRKCHALMQRIASEVQASGRAVIRLYVPFGRLRTALPRPGKQPQIGTDGQMADAAEPPEGEPLYGVIANDLEDALDHIFVEVVPSTFATVFTDADTQEKIGIVIYYRQGQTPGVTGPKVVELTYLDGTPDMPRRDRNTVVRLADAIERPALFTLGGRLTHYAVVSNPLITSQIVEMQKALNLAMSMLPRNVETSGFLERILTNAQLPGKYEDLGNGERRFVPDRYVTGAGSVQNILGAEITQPDASVQLATPGVIFRPPSPVDPTVSAINALVEEILHESKQAHVLGTDQVQSGISRTQARADFEKSLSRTQAAIEPAGRWLLETVLAWAVEFATDTQGIDDTQYRATFECQTDTGPLDPTEKAAISQAGQLGFVSRAWVMQALGVEDTDAELARLNAEPGKDIQLRQLKATALKAFTDAGLSLAAAAELAGFEDEEITLITDDEKANPVPAPLPGGAQVKLGPDGKPMIGPDGKPVMELAPPAPGAPPASNGLPPSLKPPLPPNAPPVPAPSTPPAQRKP